MKAEGSMKVRGLIALILILNVFVTVSSSGAQENKLLSLEDCIQIALQNNSNLKIALERLDLAEKDYKASFSNILPQVDAGYGFNKWERGPTFYLGGEFVGPNPFTDKITTGRNYSASLSVGQNIFDGGYWWNNIKKSKVDRQAEYAGYLSQKQATIVQVEESYFTLLRELKLLEVDEQAVRRSEEQLQRTESLYELGSVAQVDVFRARVNLGNDRIAYLNQKNVVAKAKQDLNLAMGRNPQEPLNIQKEFEYSKRVTNLEEYIQQALQQNPALKQVEKQYKSAKLQVKLAKSSFLPRLRAFYSYSRRVPQFAALYEDFSREYTWALGFNISWNLFNGFSDFVNVQKSKINERILSEQLQDYRRNLISSVKSLYDNIKAYDEIIKINEENLESAREEYRLAQERYRVGSGTALELREAQVNLTRAEQILVSAEYNAFITYARLREVVGQLINAYE